MFEYISIKFYFIINKVTLYKKNMNSLLRNDRLVDHLTSFMKNNKVDNLCYEISKKISTDVISYNSILDVCGKKYKKILVSTTLPSSFNADNYYLNLNTNSNYLCINSADILEVEDKSIVLLEGFNIFLNSNIFNLIKKSNCLIIFNNCNIEIKEQSQKEDVKFFNTFIFNKCKINFSNTLKYSGLLIANECVLENRNKLLNYIFEPVSSSCTYLNYCLTNITQDKVTLIKSDIKQEHIDISNCVINANTITLCNCTSNFLLILLNKFTVNSCSLICKFTAGLIEKNDSQIDENLPEIEISKNVDMFSEFYLLKTIEKIQTHLELSY